MLVDKKIINIFEIIVRQLFIRNVGVATQFGAFVVFIAVVTLLDILLVIAVVIIFDIIIFVGFVSNFVRIF